MLYLLRKHSSAFLATNLAAETDAYLCIINANLAFPVKAAAGVTQPRCMGTGKGCSKSTLDYTVRGCKENAKPVRSHPSYGSAQSAHQLLTGRRQASAACAAAAC